MKRAIPSEPYTQQELAWLSAIIEAEGSIVNYKTSYTRVRKDRGGKSYKSHGNLYGITIVNTDTLLLEKIASIYDSIGVRALMYQKQSMIHPHIVSFNARRQCYQIDVRRREDVKKLSLLVYPYMFGEKKAKVEKLLYDLESTKNSKYNRFGRVTTERESPNNLQRMKELRVKLQSGLYGNIQKVAEMTISAE